VIHKHHIVPKHMGGTDEESNLVELTIEEHAEAHRKLYEKYGKIEDKISNSVSGENNGMFRKDFSSEHRNKLRQSKLGIELSYDHKKSISKTLSGKTKPKLECPKCGNVAAAHVAYRYHFSNCKSTGIDTVL